MAIDLRDHLQNEFIDRCKKNKKYSLRQYSKSLNIDHSSLSQILNYKRKMTRGMILKLSQALNLESKLVSEILDELKTPEVTSKAFTQLTLDSHKIIAEWYHCAIFEMVTIKDFDPDFKKMARQLSLSEECIRESVHRLIRVGLLEQTKDGLLKQKENFVSTIGNNFLAASFRLLQKGLMERSSQALENIPFENRDHSSMTMAINSKRVGEVKKRIRKFRRSLCEELQAEKSRDSVYQLLISFFPLTQIPEDQK